MILKISTLVLLLIFKVQAIPFDGAIVFQDEDGIQEEKEGILAPAGEAKSLPDEDEIVLQKLENGDFFQGDIKLLDEQTDYLKGVQGVDSPLSTRTGILSEYYRWPKDRSGSVIVPYYISPKSGFTNYQINLLALAMLDLETYTCVKFVERTYEEDFVYIYSGDGCHSHLGKIGGQQEISLKKNGCFSRGTIIHEFIHALGYDHMHSHALRDKYVDIQWQNIIPSTSSNFDKVDPKKFGNFGTNYDLYSVMHYDSKAFSKNGKETIVPRNRRYQKIMGQRKGLSYGDVKRINNMYNCYE